MEMLLNGHWELGLGRNYGKVVKVPGLATDPAKMEEDTLWYRREVELPRGDWTHATLVLNGARFCPAVYVDGEKVSETAGGMTVTTHLLKGKNLAPGKRITLEIALKSLKDTDPQDASRIPQADLWRSNISSCLWDDVKLRFHTSARINRVIPFTDIRRDQVSVYWEMETLPDQYGLPVQKRMPDQNQSPYLLNLQILDMEGIVAAEGQVREAPEKGKGTIRLGGACQVWSPENPVCYRLRVQLLAEGQPMEKDGPLNEIRILDSYEMAWGFKEFGIDGLKFKLNEKPVTMRAGTVVWHRWARDPESRELVFDTDWFEKNVVLRLKSHGANAIRFHLGMPPEALLDLCDKHGLLAQLEWSFFHGMKASRESLVEQWRNWLDLAMRHPSTAIIHAWNETEGEELRTAFSALEDLAPEYPPLVIGHKDVIHVHKYWWSMFENVGLYYDTVSQFDRPIMVDEFGGNYLDGECNPGKYPALKEALLRFLGRGHTKDLRLQLNTESNTRIAEYWRRLGAAGFSPFCILGSREDGNHHFLGKLREANPKPVWDGLTAAYSPLSCSLEVWDRNFEPGQKVTLPLYFFNDTGIEAMLSAAIRVISTSDPASAVMDLDFVNPALTDRVREEQQISCKVAPYSMERVEVTLTLPEEEGNWCFQAILNNTPAEVTHPVISAWSFQTLQPKVPDGLKNVKIAVPDWEKELAAFLGEYGLSACKIGDPSAKVLVTSRRTWERMAGDSNAEASGIRKSLEEAVQKGCSIVMLDMGPIELGQGYLPNNDLGPLQGVMKVKDPETHEEELFYGTKIIFKQNAEPESCIHPSQLDASLWEGLQKQATWLWNGLRGGLIVPARDMEIMGMSPSAFLSQWANRGADVSAIREASEKGSGYYAYELAGFYAFSHEQDEKVMRALQEKVIFLVEDAPALQTSINPNAPIQVLDLAKLYRDSRNGRAESLEALANCGKNLSRTPVVQIRFGEGNGSLILSQLITAGRLAEGFGQEGLYGLRKDPAAIQLVMNMIRKSMEEK